MPLRPIVEGEVAQRLVALTIAPPRLAAASPDRFADAAHVAAVGRAFPEEFTPRGEHASGVAPKLLHVYEAHPLRVVSERLCQQLGPGTAHGDEQGLLRGQGVADERERSAQEAALALVEESLVVKGARRVAQARRPIVARRLIQADGCSLCAHRALIGLPPCVCHARTPRHRLSGTRSMPSRRDAWALDVPIPCPGAGAVSAHT